MDENVLRERLAELCHSQWAGWMKYLFDRSTFLFKGGSYILGGMDVKRWQRQMRTEYKDLSEKVKDSDRREADRILKLLKEVKEEDEGKI